MIPSIVGLFGVPLCHKMYIHMKRNKLNVSNNITKDTNILVRQFKKNEINALSVFTIEKITQSPIYVGNTFMLPIGGKQYTEIKPYISIVETKHDDIEFGDNCIFTTNRYERKVSEFELQKTLKQYDKEINELSNKKYGIRIDDEFDKLYIYGSKKNNKYIGLIISDDLDKLKSTLYPDYTLDIFLLLLIIFITCLLLYSLLPTH